MTASISDLIARLDTEANDLARTVTRTDSEPDLERFLAGWPMLSQAVERSLRALPVTPTAADRGLRSTLAVLEPILNFEGAWRWAGHTDPPVQLHTMAQCYGLIADLLTDVTPLVLANPEQADRLRVALVAPLAMAADATLAAWPDDEQRLVQRWHLHWIRSLADPASLRTPPDSGMLGTVAAVPGEEPILDAAITRWAEACRTALLSDHSTSRTAFEAAARGVVIVTAMSATAFHAAAKLGHLRSDAADHVVHQLIEAHQAWRTCAAWPAHVTLAGLPNAELRDASRDLRARISDLMHGPDGRWAPAGEIFERTPPRELLATVGRALRLASTPAGAYYHGLSNLVRGRGQLWIAARAVNPALADPDVLTAARRGSWVPMPRQHPDGPSMLWAAEHAADQLSAARGAADHLIWPTRSLGGTPLVGVGVERSVKVVRSVWPDGRAPRR